jgi:hypothetical protein
LQSLQEIRKNLCADGTKGNVFSILGVSSRRKEVLVTKFPDKELLVVGEVIDY